MSSSARICIPIIAAATRSSSARAFIIHRKEVEAARAEGAQTQGYIAAEWEQGAPIDMIDGQRDVFGDGRIVLMPLPGHTPGTTGALVRLDRSGEFFLASDTVSFRSTLDTGVVPKNTWNADALVKSLAEIRRIEKAGRDKSSAVTMPRNGRVCVRGKMPMSDAPEVHARPKLIGARIKRTEDPRLLTGQGAYTDDRQLSRVLHAAFRRSDQSHARIRAIDCTDGARGARR